MTERRWYHLHWTTTAALMLVGGCLVWCDFVGSHRSLKYLWAGTRSVGWPWEHFDGRRDFSPARALANFVAGALILVGVAAVLEPPRRVSARRPQFRLVTLLVIIADIAALTALVRAEVEWPDQRPPISSRLTVLGHWARSELNLPDQRPLGPYYVPISWYPLPVRFGILVGLGYAFFAVVRVAVRLVRRALSVAKSS